MGYHTARYGARRGIVPLKVKVKILSSRPCLFLLSQAWVFEVDKSIKREKIKKGLYPGDPDDLPIQAPLEMFNVAGADFLDPVLYVHMSSMPKLFPALTLMLFCVSVQALRKKDLAGSRPRIQRSKSVAAGETMAGALQKVPKAAARPADAERPTSAS